MEVDTKMQRLDANAISPEGRDALMALYKHVENSGLERSLIDLINVRASQINGCGYCLWLHHREALAHGERAERLHVLPAWREVDGFSARERAALAWTEAVTRLSAHGVDDATYAQAREHFDEAGLVALNYAAVSINAWNRLAIPFRKAPPVRPVA